MVIENKTQKQKKQVLGILALVFVLIMLYLTYDIMNRTTLPGKKKHLPTSITP